MADFLQQIKAVVFDLDGTLVDSQLDFTELRRRLGWPEHTLILEHLATLSCAVERQQAAQIIVDFELEGARKLRKHHAFERARPRYEVVHGSRR